MKIQCISIYQVCGPSQTITRRKPDKFLTERKSDDFRYMNFHIRIFIYLKSSFVTWMFIWTQFIDQLPVGLLAQLVEHCTGIAEVMGSNPVRA